MDIQSKRHVRDRLPHLKIALCRTIGINRQHFNLLKNRHYHQPFEAGTGLGNALDIYPHLKIEMIIQMVEGNVKSDLPN